MAKYIPCSELLAIKNYRDRLIVNSTYYSFFTTQLMNLANAIKINIAECQQWEPEQGSSASFYEAGELIMNAKAKESAAILEEIENILAKAANMGASV